MLQVFGRLCDEPIEIFLRQYQCLFQILFSVFEYISEQIGRFGLGEEL